MHTPLFRCTRDVLEGVLLLMGQEDTSWAAMKSFLGKRSVKEDIINYDARRWALQMRTRDVCKVLSVVPALPFSSPRAVVPPTSLRCTAPPPPPAQLPGSLLPCAPRWTNSSRQRGSPSKRRCERTTLPLGYPAGCKVICCDVWVKVTPLFDVCSHVHLRREMAEHNAPPHRRCMLLPAGHLPREPGGGPHGRLGEGQPGLCHRARQGERGQKHP